MAFGFLATRLFKLPSWVTPALCFNNTTSLPLLLIESLETTGILDKLIMGDSDSSSAALLRAKSYLLVNSVVGNSLTFALGPKLLDGEESPEQEEEEQKQANGGSTQTQQDAEQGYARVRSIRKNDKMVMPTARKLKRRRKLTSRHHYYLSHLCGEGSKPKASVMTRAGSSGIGYIHGLGIS